MIIQKLKQKDNEERIFKTVTQESNDFRSVTQWDPESKDVNLLAKSLFNNSHGIL